MDNQQLINQNLIATVYKQNGNIFIPEESRDNYITAMAAVKLDYRFLECFSERIINTILLLNIFHY